MKSSELTLTKLQAATKEWQDKNFPDATSWQKLLGICEEVGELAHAHLKGAQGIRHTPAEIEDMKKDAVGDLVIFLCGYCSHERIDLADAVFETWLRVSGRDYINDPALRKEVVR